MALASDSKSVREWFLNAQLLYSMRSIHMLNPYAGRNRENSSEYEYQTYVHDVAQWPEHKKAEGCAE